MNRRASQSRRGDKSKAILEVVQANPGIQAPQVMDILKSHDMDVSLPMIYHVMKSCQAVRSEIVLEDLQAAKEVLADIGSAGKVRKVLEFAQRVGVEKAMRVVQSLEDLRKI